MEGYDKLQNVLTGDGETPGALELNDGEYAYLDGNLYAVGGKLYRMATISDEDGNSTNQLVELLIADDGALSLGGRSSIWATRSASSRRMATKATPTPAT